MSIFADFFVNIINNFYLNVNIYLKYFLFKRLMTLIEIDSDISAELATKMVYKKCIQFRTLILGY